MHRSSQFLHICIIAATAAFFPYAAEAFSAVTPPTHQSSSVGTSSPDNDIFAAAAPSPVSSFQQQQQQLRTETTTAKDVPSKTQTKGSITVSCNVHLPGVPTNVAYQVYANVTRQPEFTPHLDSVKLLQRPNVPYGVGSISEWTVRYWGLQFKWQSKSTLLEPPYALEWASHKGMGNAGRVDFLEDNDGTNMRVVMHIAIPRLALRLMGRNSNAQERIESVIKNRILRVSLRQFRDLVTSEMMEQEQKQQQNKKAADDDMATEAFAARQPESRSAAVVDVDTTTAAVAADDDGVTKLAAMTAPTTAAGASQFTTTSAAVATAAAAASTTTLSSRVVVAAAAPATVAAATQSSPPPPPFSFAGVNRIRRNAKFQPVVPQD